MTPFRSYVGVAGEDTLIGHGIHVAGNLNCQGDVTVEGSASGKIIATGSINISTSSSLEADISADNISVAGSVKGELSAINEVIIRETGSVIGGVASSRLIILPGGVFSGRSRITGQHIEDPS